MDKNPASKLSPPLPYCTSAPAHKQLFSNLGIDNSPPPRKPKLSRRRLVCKTAWCKICRRVGGSEGRRPLTGRLVPEGCSSQQVGKECNTSWCKSSWCTTSPTMVHQHLLQVHQQLPPWCTSTSTPVQHYTGLSGSLGTRPMVCRQYIAAFALAFFLSLVATDPM